MESHIQLVSALRDMLRDDFGMANNRDMAVAAAVNDWYLAQFQSLASMADKPDLGHIIAKVRTATYAPTFVTGRAADKWTDDQISELIGMAKPPLVFNRIQLPTDERAAIRDAALEEAALVVRNGPFAGSRSEDAEAIRRLKTTSTKMDGAQ